jgi:hypothetical protein
MPAMMVSGTTGNTYLRPICVLPGGKGEYVCS